MKFKRNNDTFEVRIGGLVLLWLSWLFKQPTDLKPFFSFGYEYPFASFKDYYYEIGKRNSFIDLLTHKSKSNQPAIGYTNIEMMGKLARLLAGTSPCVVIGQIDPVSIGRLQDWFPTLDRTLFLEDVIFLPAKSRQSALKLVQSLPANVCVAAAFDSGEVIGANTAL